jgi:membrane associated rhomboid family serine protease
MNELESKERSIAGVGRLPSVSLLLGAVALCVHFAERSMDLAFKISEPDLMRWFTGHWAHWSDEHLLWSAGAFVLLGAACELRDRKAMLRLVVFSAILIPAVLIVLPHGIGIYGGLSGIDSALFGALIVTANNDLKERPNRMIRVVPMLCGAGFVLKMGYELLTGHAFFVDGGDSMVAVPVAHIVGFLIGVVDAQVNINRHKMILDSRK